MRTFFKVFIEAVCFMIFLLSVCTAYTLYKKSVEQEKLIEEMLLAIETNEAEIRKLKQDIVVINNIVYTGDFIKR